MLIQQSLGASDALYVVGIISAFTIAGVLYAMRLKKQGKKMVTEKEAHELEWKYIQLKLSDAIADVIVDALREGRIRRELATRLFQRFGSQGLPDLLPRAGYDLKRRIRLRLYQYDWTPVNFPGTEPLPALPVVEAKDFGSALSRFKKPVGKTVTA